MSNTSSSNQQLIALGLLIFCAIAVLLGIFQLARQPVVMKTTDQKYTRNTNFKTGSDDILAYISLEGMIIENEDKNTPFSQESSAVRTRKLLYYAASDPYVKGVLLRINSPGGTVAMSQELNKAVLAVKQNKPVVVSMGDLAASGAYYTAVAADKIVANPGTLTASIGVILQSVNLKGLLTDKLGIYPVTVKSGKFKDILSPYRSATTDEMKLLQNMIDTSYRQFLKAVLDGRTGSIEDARLKTEKIDKIVEVADGRIVVGEDALRVGLVDEIGGVEEARILLQNLAAKRFNIKDPESLTLEDYETPFDIFSFLGLHAAKNFDLSAIIGQKSLSTEILPITIRYANQPLWVMEGIY